VPQIGECSRREGDSMTAGPIGWGWCAKRPVAAADPGAADDDGDAAATRTGATTGCILGPFRRRLWRRTRGCLHCETSTAPSRSPEAETESSDDPADDDDDDDDDVDDDDVDADDDDVDDDDPVEVPVAVGSAKWEDTMSELWTGGGPAMGRC
jgi:hypothetical protein